MFKFGEVVSPVNTTVPTFLPVILLLIATSLPFVILISNVPSILSKSISPKAA